LTTVPEGGFQPAQVESTEGSVQGPQFPTIDESALEAEVSEDAGDPASALVAS
jgi:hypothetical protein